MKANLLNLYFYLIKLRNFFYDVGILKSYEVGVPCISVGNLSVGGTGKTPLVRAIVEALHSKYKIALISRGYKRKSFGTVLVYKDGNLQVNLEEAGDEAYLLGKYFQKKKILSPVIIVDKNRVRAAKIAINKFECNLILLDDGFQHRKIKRDLDLVLLKKRDIKDELLPFGRLREPISSLKRASALLLSYQEVEPFEFTFGNLPVFKIFRKNWKVLNWQWKEVPLSEFKRKEVVAFCGLGNNEQFFLTLNKLGIKVKKKLSFRDHQSYEGMSFDLSEVYLTTLKDWVKLPLLKNIFFLDFELEVKGFFEWLLEKIEHFERKK